MTDEQKTAQVRHWNDLLRTTGLCRNGKVIVTGGLVQADPILREQVVSAVRDFTDFTEDNDPHGEHDLGRFEVEGETFMFKIDYYALDELHGSEHPEDPAVTVRILSIFYGHDY